MSYYFTFLSFCEWIAEATYITEVSQRVAHVCQVLRVVLLGRKIHAALGFCGENPRNMSATNEFSEIHQPIVSS